MSAKKISIILSRILVGLPLLVFGANAFIGFMPKPDEIPAEERGFSAPAYELLNQPWDSGFRCLSRGTLCPLIETHGLDPRGEEMCQRPQRRR